jgi:ATP-binding protein involved in chromosome partitioning
MNNFRPVLRAIPNVRRAILVASGKGGVGKSNVSANVAIALSILGKRVGLLDADLYGPSIPQLMHLSIKEPQFDELNRFLPLSNYNVHCMSIAMMLPRPEAAVVWRGLMVTKALQQMLFQTAWPALDYLIIDTPPGTGDTHLTITQNAILSGAVIVSTGQTIAQNVAQRGVDMLRKVQVPILGWVRNMSWYSCSSCHQRHQLFSSASSLDIPLLGDIPLVPEACHQADQGLPVMVQDHGDPANSMLALQKEQYLKIANKLISLP